MIGIFSHDLCHDVTEKSKVNAESIYRPYVVGKTKSKQGRMADALALGGEEGRDKLR